MSKKLTWVGISITLFYLAAVVVLGWAKWGSFFGMELNAIGDFLAGVVGPLALLWLILGYFQQGEELRLSTAALAQQAEELRQSVEHQRELVEVTKQQVQVQLEQFKSEQAAARNRLMPRFDIRPERRSMSGLSTSVNFVLENIGYRASAVRLQCDRPDLLRPPTEWQVIDTKQSVEFRIRDLEPEDIGSSFTFTVSCVDGAGESWAEAIGATVRGANIGVIVELGTWRLLTDC